MGGREVNGRGKRWASEGVGKILFLDFSAGIRDMSTFHKHVPLWVVHASVWILRILGKKVKNNKKVSEQAIKLKMS